MNWIINNKKALIVTSLLSVFVALLFIFYLHDKDTIENVEQWQLGLFVLPWVTFASSILPLMYLSWFKTNKFGSAQIILKTFYWVMVCGFFVIFGVIYVLYVF